MKKYVLLAVLALLIYFLHSFFLPSGGVGADSLSYFGIASDFPRLETNLFPVGYPLAIRIFYEIFSDYFWASKLLNFSLLLVLLLFAWFRKFYFKETVLLLIGKTFFYVFTGIASESLFLFLCYFLIYFFHQRFHHKIASFRFIFLVSLTMLLLFTVRYSGVYIYISLILYWVFLKIKKSEKKILKDLFWVILLSGVAIGSYLLWNYSQFGSFTGENLRGKPSEILPIDLLRNFFGIINVVDPFILIKPSSNSATSLLLQFFIFIIDVFLAVLLFRLYRKKKSYLNLDFHYLLWCIAGTYTVALFLSSFYQEIEEMNVRMLAAANVFIYFSGLIMYFTHTRNDKIIYRVALFFLFFLTVYSLKNPSNFIQNKAQIEPQIHKLRGKKYIFNDEQDQVYYTTYRLPILNKDIRYPHTTFQKGSVKQNVVGAINPQIKWLKYDTVKDKTQVLYTSELVLYKLNE